MNPDLIQPGQVGNQAARVSPQARFKGTDERGNLVESAAPEGTTIVKPRYYTSTIANMNMHRFDGTKIAFTHHFLETEVAQSQKYLDDEIANGNGYIAHATAEEIDNYHMRKNPKAYITEQVRGELEPQMRIELENQIREEMRLQLSTLDDIDKLGGVDEVMLRLERARKAGDTTVQHTGNATVTLTGQAAAEPLMDSKGPHLQGIVGSDKVADLAAGSSGGPLAGLAGLAARK